MMNKLHQIAKKTIGPFSKNDFWIKSQIMGLAVCHKTVLLDGGYLTSDFHSLCENISLFSNITTISETSIHRQTLKKKEK